MLTITNGRNLNPTARHTHRMKVRSRRSGKVYTIARANSGQWQCSCMGWRFHRHCRHLDEFLAR